jgi:hypothetical protein
MERQSHHQIVLETMSLKIEKISLWPLGRLEVLKSENEIGSTSRYLSITQQTAKYQRYCKRLEWYSVIPII